MATPDVATTKKLIIPDGYLPTVYQKVRANAVIPTLISEKPKLYNNEDMIYMDERPKAQYVGEGTPKSASDWSFGTKPMHKFKLQTTIRMTEETEFADEDSSLELLDVVFDAMGDSLGEGVDAGMIHAIDPYSGSVMESAQSCALALVGNQIVTTGDLQADVDALPDSVLKAGHLVNGIALDNMWANDLRKLRNKNTSARLYPDITMSLEVGNFEGIKSVTSANVSGRPFGTDTGIKAIIGDWNMAQWGIIREMKLRKFDVGDPDGRGYDLAFKNEVAYRVEMLFAFGVAYNDAFAVLRDSAASGVAETRAAKASTK